MGFLQVFDFTIPAGDPLLGFRDSIERSFQPAHPASQRSTLALQTRSELLESALALGIWDGRYGGANKATARSGHQLPSMIWTLMSPF
jgi:hypothetical protein